MNIRNKRYAEYTEAEKVIARKAARSYYNKNKEKQKQKHFEWYILNKESVLEKQKLKKRARKLEAINYLGGFCCKCGGVFHPAVYEFHHTKPEEKDRDPSKMMQLSKERLMAELDKCILLCANCHRIEHHGDSY